MRYKAEFLWRLQVSKLKLSFSHNKSFYSSVVLGLTLLVSSIIFAAKNNPPAQIPEFTQTKQSAWINSKPLTINNLRGKVLLVDIWTFNCWNCYRSFPWLISVEKKFSGQGFQVIGVHTPEFEHEKERENVVAKIKEFMLHHPIMMDNDFAYWRSLNNQYWPAYYIVDKQGNIRGAFIGETHEGDPRAVQIESLIAKLLKEDPV